MMKEKEYDKQIYVPLEIDLLEIQMERGYAGSATSSGEDGLWGADWV